MTPQTLGWQLLAVLTKEVRQTAKDRRVVFLLTVAPFLQLLLFGFALDTTVDRVPTVLVDDDRDAETRALAAALFADGSLELVATVPDVPTAERWLDRGDAAAAVVMPPTLSRDRARRAPAVVQVLLDGSDPTRSGVAGGAAGQFFGGRGLGEARAAAASAGLKVPAVQIRPRLLFNPGLRSPVYRVPGIAGMLLLIITTIVTSMGLAHENELGTLEQVRVTPIPTPVLLLGKVLPFVAIGLFDVTLALTAGAWIFDVPLRGSLGLFYVTTCLYLLTTVGMGLLIATVAATQQQAFLGGFIFILPAMLLSGTMTPIHAMPSWLLPLTDVNPLRYYMEAIRAILLQGATVSDVAPQLAKLTLLGSLIMATATWRFRKTVG